MQESKTVKAIFPYLHPEYPKLIENVLKNKGTVELIIPQSIFKEMIFRINGYASARPEPVLSVLPKKKCKMW